MTENENIAVLVGGPCDGQRLAVSGVILHTGRLVVPVFEDPGRFANNLGSAQIANFKSVVYTRVYPFERRIGVEVWVPEDVASRPDGMHQVAMQLVNNYRGHTR